MISTEATRSIVLTKGVGSWPGSLRDTIAIAAPINSAPATKANPLHRMIVLTIVKIPSFNLTLVVAPGLRWNTARIGPWDAQFMQLRKVSTLNNRTGIRTTTHLEPSVRPCYVKPGNKPVCKSQL
jgi:hypothetical protein